MPAAVRFLAFWLIALGSSVLRTSIGVGSGEQAVGLQAFDCAVDALMAAIALIVGVWFYIPVGGVLYKPGTPTAISATDVAGCAVVAFMAFIPVVALPILLGHFGPGLGKQIVTLWIPDIFAALALAFVVVTLT